MFAQEYGEWNANGKGNLILSTYPIYFTESLRLIRNADRSIAMATITVNARPITLINTHLDPYDQALRLAQATEVTTWAAPQPENRILAGDMNAWPDQTSIAHFNTLYHDSWAVAAAKGTAAAFAGNNGETKNGRIDYIFYSKAPRTWSSSRRRSTTPATPAASCRAITARCSRRSKSITGDLDRENSRASLAGVIVGLAGQRYRYGKRNRHTDDPAAFLTTLEEILNVPSGRCGADTRERCPDGPR